VPELRSVRTRELALVRATQWSMALSDGMLFAEKIRRVVSTVPLVQLRDRRAARPAGLSALRALRGSRGAPGARASPRRRGRRSQRGPALSPGTRPAGKRDSVAAACSA
jgi:hypothetical protein